MAILNSIRKRGVFLIIIIALALFAFVLDGVINSKTQGGGDIQDTVGNINGVELSREDFMAKVEAQQRSMGPNANTAQAVNVVWDREMKSALLNQQVDELGMTISPEQLSETLALVLGNNPTFQNEAGVFSEAKMIEYVANIRNTGSQAEQQWNDFIESTKQGILQTNYLNMVRSGMVSTLAEGEQQYRYENDKINMQFVYVPYTKISDDDVAVSETEIAAYIKANPKQFEVEPMVDIEYITFKEEPSLEDIEAQKVAVAAKKEAFASAEEVEVYVNGNSENEYVDRWVKASNLPANLKDTILNIPQGTVYGPYKDGNTWNLSKVVASRQMPDSVKARHILIPVGLNRTDSITRSPEEAKTLADSLVKVIKANRSKFPALVKQFTSDTPSIANDGLYDWYGYNKMVAPFRDFTFEGTTGDVGVAESQFGYHVIEVMGQKDMSEAVKIATVTVDIEPSEQTLSDVFSKGAKFEEAARTGDFSALAAESGLSPKPVNKIGKLDAAIPGIGNNRTIINWAFGEESKVGDVKRFNIDDSYVVARLTRKSTEKALMSVAEASASVIPILRNEKKAAKIRESISGTTLQEIASSQNVQVRTASAITRSNPTIAGAGTDPLVVGTAFGVKAGESTDLIDGKDGVYKVKVLAVNPAPDLEDYSSYASALNASNATNVNQNLYKALEKAADIEDNRASFY